MNAVTLLGMDFGTTTSCAVIAKAKLVHNAVTGRKELSEVVESFRSPLAFTPMLQDRIDELQVKQLLDDWIDACGDGPIFGGGALLTGLTARAGNAAALVAMIRARLGDAVVACADDPRLESWLAFMGSCARLSRRHPRAAFINLDVGGGTTNLALGINGEVHATGCLFIGARHVQVVPGTYRIVKISSYARQLFGDLGIHKDQGDVLDPAEVNLLLNCYLKWLVAAVDEDHAAFESPVARLHRQAAFHASRIRNVPCLPAQAGLEGPSGVARPRRADPQETIITLSGGVGELVYAALQSGSFPPKTAFGDLGIDLAQRLLYRSPWSEDFRKFLPESGGRATSFGLLRHSTQVSGSTLFLAEPKILPLRDIPILGTIDASLPPEQWQAILQLLKSSTAGGCLQVTRIDPGADAVRKLGLALSGSLQSIDFPPTQPLVIIVPGNVGKTLGAYITRWGARPRALVVLDEISAGDARFVHLGRQHDRVVPVSFYGLQA